ncbi:MAG: DNA-directed RNA polymerase [Methanocellales archaeon]|nr:DNA-directed RNA polymerase [Methanocellales archaeon]
MNKGGYSSRGFDRPPREMHKVTCADCGVETEVLFKPDGTRPVYCTATRNIDQSDIK